MKIPEHHTKGVMEYARKRMPIKHTWIAFAFLKYLGGSHCSGLLQYCHGYSE